MQVHTGILPKSAFDLIQKIALLPFIQSFYLSGGTALALQLGHRESEDLDFFTEEDFIPELVQQELLTIDSLQDTEISKGTLNTFIETVKLQFLHYPYRLLEEPLLWNKIKLSSIADIACTKLVTISARGSKKDFIDLYFILKRYSLKELLERLEQKYKGVNYNQAHILKSLVYFADAEEQPMPRMHIQADWDEIRSELIEAVKKIKIQDL